MLGNAAAGGLLFQPHAVFSPWFPHSPFKVANANNMGPLNCLLKRHWRKYSERFKSCTSQYPASDECALCSKVGELHCYHFSSTKGRTSSDLVNTGGTQSHRRCIWASYWWGIRWWRQHDVFIRRFSLQASPQVDLGWFSNNLRQLSIW